MSRIVDEPYFTYSAYNALTSGIQVKCPKCHGAGVVTADDDNAYFRCLSCGHRMTQDRTIYRYDVHNQCKNCGRYYRVDIEDTAKQHFPVLHVTCPYCGTTMSGEVHKTAEAFSYIGEIRDGREPYFGLELWFLTSFQGKPVWALNREHLAYLIGYLSAGLREKPPGRAKMTQADHLPTFMKTANEEIYTERKDRFQYDKWINEYLQYFRPEQIKVVVMEELMRNSEEQMKEIQEFIGVKHPICVEQMPNSNEGSAVSANWLGAYINYRYYASIRGRKENTTRSKKQKLFFRFARWVQRYTTIENHDKMTDEQKRKMDAFYKPSVERLEKMTGLPVRKLWDI